MILRAHQAAKKVAVEQVIAEEGDEIDTLLDQEYKKDHTPNERPARPD
jgi:hypothetical protein